MRWKRGVQTWSVCFWSSPVSKHLSQHHYGRLIVILDSASDLDLAELHQSTRCSYHTLRVENLRVLCGNRTAYRLCIQHWQRGSDLGESRSGVNKHVSNAAWGILLSSSLFIKFVENDRTVETLETTSYYIYDCSSIIIVYNIHNMHYTHKNIIYILSDTIAGHGVHDDNIDDILKNFFL